MFNSIKATVQKLSEICGQDFLNLFSWPGSHTINAENPRTLIAKASKSSGQTIAFVSAEPVLLIDSYVFNPAISPNEAATAGDAIDKSLAAQAGVQRMWVLIPEGVPPMEGETTIRVMERRVYQPAAPQLSYEIKHSVAYLN